MSRELQSDAVSSVDRSSSGIADEQPAPQLQRESMSTESMATTSSAVPTAAGGDEPTAATSTEHSSPVPENDSTSTVSIITSAPVYCVATFKRHLKTLLFTAA